MIPLRSTERVYATTLVTGGLIVLNLLIFIYQETLSPYELNNLVYQWGIVPDERPFRVATLLTSMFLHGSWMHVLGNMLYLWVFGRNMEDLVGGVRFLLFYILCGLAAAAAQVMISPYSRVPTIGASGAIAGVMGAYLIRFPRARIITLVFFFFITTLELPAAFVLLFWFALQFLDSLVSGTNYTGGGVAYFAHIGGFIAGMLLIRLFPVRRRWRSWYVDE